MLTHGAVTQECRQSPTGETQCNFSSVAVIWDLSGVASIDLLHLYM